MRKNKFVTDLKYKTKRSLDSMERRLTKLAANWGDTDFFIQGEIEQVISKLSEIREEVAGIDTKTH